MTPKRIRFLRRYITEEGYDYARWRAMNKESAEWFRDFLVFHDKFARHFFELGLKARKEDGQ